MSKRQRVESTLPPENILISDQFYPAWIQISTFLQTAASPDALVSLWNLSSTCAALHSYIGKSTWVGPVGQGNALATAHSNVAKVCVVCKAPCTWPWPSPRNKIVNLCVSCRSLNDFRMVSATTAEREFGVRACDVKTLTSCATIRGDWGCYAAYLVSDVLKLPKKVSSKAAITRSQNKEARKALLEKALIEQGLSLRQDSELCRRFIAGSIKWDVRAIVQRMAEMKVLHEYWDFNRYRQEAISEAREEGEWLEKDELADRIEDLALEDHGGAYPDVWPWIE